MEELELGKDGPTIRTFIREVVVQRMEITELKGIPNDLTIKMNLLRDRIRMLLRNIDILKGEIPRAQKRKKLKKFKWSYMQSSSASK